MMNCKVCETKQQDDSKFCMNCGTSFNNSIIIEHGTSNSMPKFKADNPILLKKGNKPTVKERRAIRWENYKERKREKLREQFKPLFEEILDIIEGDRELVDYKVEKVKKETVDGSPGHFIRISFHSKNSTLMTIYR